VSSRSRALAWLLVLVWFVWILAFQGWLARGAGFGRLTPDLGSVFLVSLAGTLARRDVLLAALVAALARKSLSIDPAAAILFGMLALGGVAHALRSVVEIGGPFWRTLLSCAGAVGFSLWLQLVRAARHGSTGLELEPGALAWSAVASALVALALGGFLVRLPGLSPLRRTAW